MYRIYPKGINVYEKVNIYLFIYLFVCLLLYLFIYFPIKYLS